MCIARQTWASPTLLPHSPFNTQTHTPTVGNQGLNMKMEGHLWWLLSILLAEKTYQYTFFVLYFAIKVLTSL